MTHWVSWHRRGSEVICKFDACPLGWFRACASEKMICSNQDRYALSLLESGLGEGVTGFD